LPVRVAFAGLWTVADREGRFRWRPEELKLDCLPYDDVDFAEVLAALQTAGFVQKYVVDDREYGVVPSWSEHQVINQREAQSSLPEPGGTVVTSNCCGEGKGREEEGKGTEGSPEALTRSVPADAAALFEFPTVGPGGSSWRLRRVQVDEWRTSFPNLDVLAECRKARAWVIANPGRRKTAKGMPKFLVSWLSRAVDSGRASFVPAMEPIRPSADDAWFQECQALHDGRCGGSTKHRMQMVLDAGKVKAS
jgi:hypothetical protein